MSDISSHGIESLLRPRTVARKCHPCPRTVLLPLSLDRTRLLSNTPLQPTADEPPRLKRHVRATNMRNHPGRIMVVRLVTLMFSALSVTGVTGQQRNPSAAGRLQQFKNEKGLWR